MATLIKNPPGNKGSKKARKKVTLSPQQRFKQRLSYRLRHPVDAAWGWLSSVRTAILLISAIAAVSLIGIYFVQAPGEVLNDPAAYAAWVQQNALPRYGSLTPIYDWLQFFKIFSSWYFMLMLTILALSIVVCTLNRAPAIWQNFRHPLLRRSDKFYQNASERASFDHQDALDWTRAALRRRHYRVRSVVDSCRGGGGVEGGEDPCGRPEVTYLYANKNSWATLSTFVFHAALVTLLLAGVLSQWHGFAPDSPARRFLPAPIVGLTDNFAGFTFDQALPNGQSAIVYPRGTPHNISFRTNSFKATFDPKTGLPTDYVTDLSVYRDGELVAHSNHLRVNDPLSYGGVVFHQSSLIPSANITISDASGCIICDEPIVLDQTATVSSNLVVDYASGIPIAGTNMTLSVLFRHLPSVQLAQVQNPVILISAGVPGAALNQEKVLANLQPGQTGQSFDKQWTVTLNSASEATVLLVTKDSGSFLVWPTAVILILSLCATFYFPQRRIWMRIEGQHVQMAALREHFTNIRTDLLGVTREASQANLESPTH
jgi:cytochrome c biogenesis protein